MKFSFITIVLNGQPFLECALTSVYKFAHQIIVIEGAVEKCMFAANPDGSSSDGTVEALKNIPDPDKKIKVIQGRWPEKAEMQNEALKQVTGDYVWLLDSDEIYKETDLLKVDKLLSKDSSITQIDFIPDNFWKGFDFLFISPKFYERENHYRRIFKYRPGCHFTSHRPPTLFYPDLGKTSEQVNVMDGWKTRRLGIFPYHYSYVYESQVSQKIELYNRYGWGADWKLDLNKWYEEGFLKWTPSNREFIEKQFSVWTGDPLSFTTPFQGTHPEAMLKLIDNHRINEIKSKRESTESHDLKLIGTSFYQEAVVEAWHSIELDQPLSRLSERFTNNAKMDVHFWNLHVALAALSLSLKPKSYLEIGVRTCGSMAQVLWHAPLKNVIGIDLWSGSYAGFKNEQDFAQQQINRCLSLAGKTVNVKLIQGDSHVVLKDLIQQGKKFDLINVDGDHSEDGNLEDLEDAVSLLSERGAIVFDDVTHKNHPYLIKQLYDFEIRYPYFQFHYNTKQGHGTVILLKNVRAVEIFMGVEKLKHKTKIARNDHPGQDKTQVDKTSDFARAIEETFSKIKPRKLVESGTYLGNGTTRVIAQTLKSLEINDAVFYSIEINPNHFSQANLNLQHNGLASRVQLEHGLSVPRSILPTVDQIRKECVENPPDADIFVDHEEVDRVMKYYQETNFTGLPEDLLGKILDKFENTPDFVLLDSAGHMGFLEFQYVIQRLKASCVIALDDVYHIKHHRSFQLIRKDPRFQILHTSREKFGFCIARFSPVDVSSDSSKKQRILWFRTDSIGDGILATSMLLGLRTLYPDAHIAVMCWDRTQELYENSPFIDEVISFDKERARSDEKYRDLVLEKVKQFKPDIAFNSVYSREPLLDLFATQCGARERIAMEGDLSNMDSQSRALFDKGYTRLLPSQGIVKHEFERHKDFLKGIGYSQTELEPSIWRLPQSDFEVSRILNAEGFSLENTIVLFAGAQVAWRIHSGLGKALEPICRNRRFKVVAVGTESEFMINQKQLDDLKGIQVLNLSGKLSLMQTAALLAHCRLAVGAETGTAHLACAVGAPNVVVVGGGHFGRFMPWSPLTVAVSLPLECFGCNWQCKYSRTHCIEDIPVASITQGVIAGLDIRSKHARIVTAKAADWKAVAGVPLWKKHEIAGAVYG